MGEKKRQPSLRHASLLSHREEQHSRTPSSAHSIPLLPPQGDPGRAEGGCGPCPTPASWSLRPLPSSSCPQLSARTSPVKVSDNLRAVQPRSQCFPLIWILRDFYQHVHGPGLILKTLLSVCAPASEHIAPGSRRPAQGTSCWCTRVYLQPQPGTQGPLMLLSQEGDAASRA